MANNIELIIEADDRASGKLQRIAGVLEDVGRVGMTIAAVGIGAVAGGLALAVKEASDAEMAQAGLQAVLKSTGGVAGVTAEMVTELANSLQQVTRYSDDSIIEAQSLLLTFTKIGKDIFPDTTKIILDMSTALRQDLKSSAIQVGKALQDPILGVTALRRVGVNFSESQQEMIKSLVESGRLLDAQRFILQELQTEFGGAAEAAGQTFAGQIDIAKNAMSDMLETIGAQLLPALTELMTTITTELRKPETMESIKAFASAFVDVANALVKTLIPAVSGAFQVFNSLPEPLKRGAAMLAMVGIAASGLIGIVATLASKILTLILVFGGTGGLASVGSFLTGTVLPALGAAIAAIGAPVLALIAAVGLLGVTIAVFGRDALNTLQMIAGIIQAVFTLARWRIEEFVRSVFAIDWASIGRGIMEGIRNGINQGLGWIRDAARNAAEAALRTAKSILGIRSPSKVFEREIGFNIGEGIKRGWQRSMMDVSGAVTPWLPAPSTLAAPAMTASGRTVQVTLQYAPMISMADQTEVETRIAPMIERIIRRYNRG